MYICTLTYRYYLVFFTALALVLFGVQNKDRKNRTWVYIFHVEELLDHWDDLQRISKSWKGGFSYSILLLESQMSSFFHHQFFKSLLS